MSIPPHPPHPPPPPPLHPPTPPPPPHPPTHPHPPHPPPPHPRLYEEEERDSRYVYDLEKINSSLRSINRLELENNTITEDPTVILQEIKHFYASLYKGDDVQNAEAYLSNLKTAKI